MLGFVLVPAPPSAATYKEHTASPFPKSNPLPLSLISLDARPLVISPAGRSPFSTQFRLPKYCSHPSLVIYFFCDLTHRTKLKPRLALGGRLY